MAVGSRALEGVMIPAVLGGGFTPTWDREERGCAGKETYIHITVAGRITGFKGAGITDMQTTIQTTHKATLSHIKIGSSRV